MSLTHQHVITWVNEAIRRALPANVTDGHYRLEISPAQADGKVTISAYDLTQDAFDAGHKEVMRYIVNVAITAVPAPTPEIPAQREPEWLNGVWGDVRPGDITQGADSKEWEVVSNTHHLDGTDLLTTTVRSGEQTFTFTPDICQAVTFRRATPRESSQEGDSLIHCVD